MGFPSVWKDGSFGSMQPCRFVLQAFDPDYGHPAFETMFVVDRPADLRALLGADAEDDPAFDKWYRLEPSEVAEITGRFGVAFDPAGRATTLYLWRDDEPPYLAHGGYELVLMIEGRKPFARIDDIYFPPHRFVGEDRFDRHVATGLLHKEVQLDPFAEPLHSTDGQVFEGYRTVYYTLKGEEWRIPAWKMIAEAARKSGWNDSFERLEGMLLGYEEWQNDWWAEERRRRGLLFGKLLLHLAVTAEERAAIEGAGYRALPTGRRRLRLLSAASAELDEGECRWLMMAEENLVGLVRFAVKAGAFLTSVASDPQAARHEVPPERVKDLNRLIDGEIEVLTW